MARDYKREYATYHSKKKQKKRRAARNKSRREAIKKGEELFIDESIDFLNEYLEDNYQKYLNISKKNKQSSEDENILKEIQQAYKENLKRKFSKYGSFEKYIPEKREDKYNLGSSASKKKKQKFYKKRKEKSKKKKNISDYDKYYGIFD